MNVEKLACVEERINVVPTTTGSHQTMSNYIPCGQRVQILAFSDMTPCNLTDRNTHLGGTYIANYMASHPALTVTDPIS
jgi:hypothetical protein